MQFILFRFSLLTLVVFAVVPAVAIVVVDEDFEDDTPTTYFPLPPAVDLAPGLEGLPTNAGNPGNWLANQYHLLPWFNNPWHDDLDTNPDTNWQLQVTANIGPPRPGNEAFYQNQHTNCDLYLHCVDFKHDCNSLGLTEPGPCDNDRYSRDGFIQFSLADGTPRPAMPGEKLRVSFDFTSFDGIPVFALTNDIKQMADDTSNADLHPPLSEWNVGFGKPFNPVDEGLEAWFSGSSQHPNVVSLLTPNPGFNGRGFDVFLPVNPDDLSEQNEQGNTQLLVPLDPDFFEGPGPKEERIYQTVALEYTVGNDHYDLVTIDFNDGNGPQEVRQALEEEPHGNAPPDPGGLVPIGQSAITVQGVDGIVFTDTGGKMASYMFDNICIVINGELDECAAGPEPLIGDANGDGQVTGADLIAVQQNFGKTGTPPLPGDANNDGLVTGADLISVQQNFGNVLAAPVPEPATIALLVGCLALCRRRHRPT